MKGYFAIPAIVLLLSGILAQLGENSPIEFALEHKIVASCVMGVFLLILYFKRIDYDRWGMAIFEIICSIVHIVFSIIVCFSFMELIRGEGVSGSLVVVLCSITYLATEGAWFVAMALSAEGKRVMSVLVGAPSTLYALMLVADTIYNYFY